MHKTLFRIHNPSPLQVVGFFAGIIVANLVIWAVVILGLLLAIRWIFF